MIIKSELELCKRDMEACVGRKVRLKSNGGRKRTIIREGIVEHCYPKVFTVRCIRENHEDPEMVSYSYVDVLTDTVEVAVAPEIDETLETEEPDSYEGITEYTEVSTAIEA